MAPDEPDQTTPSVEPTPEPTPSPAVEAAPDAVLHVRFAREAGTERVVTAMQAFKAVLQARPGGTRVVVHVPAPGGTALPMELHGVAYDAELEAEVAHLQADLDRHTKVRRALRSAETALANLLPVRVKEGLRVRLDRYPDGHRPPA